MTTVTAIVGVTLVLSTAMVVRSIMRAAAYRRRREALPIYFAGNVAGGFATMFLLAGILVRENEVLQWTLLVAALICLSIDARQTRAAHRQR